MVSVYLSGFVAVIFGNFAVIRTVIKTEKQKNIRYCNVCIM